MHRRRRLTEVEPCPLGDPLLDRLVNDLKIDLCFILELLATCANTLASLDIEGALANILHDLNRSQQIDSLPQLRHFRYVPIKA